MKPTIGAALAGGAGLVAAALSALGPAGTAGAAPQAPMVRGATTIDFGGCGKFAISGIGAECGYLTVPMDWSKPSGKKIKLAVSRVKSTAPAVKYQGVMLVNPGGPGGSGLSYSALKDAMPRGSGKGYDWIGFDPRGVGMSKPALSCISNFADQTHPQYIPARQGKKPTASENAWLALSKKYAKACGTKNGALLEHMRTLDWVKDMDALRIALGAEKINYLGFSYGTYLGSVYATMYPTHVRRMLLDGNVDPKLVWYKAQLSQDKAFERTATEFFGWIAKHNKTYNLGASATAVRAKYDAVIAELTRIRQNGIGANEWTDTFLNAMYAEFLWPDAADAFASWVHNRNMDSAKRAYADAKQPDDNLFAVYSAVQCTDKKWPTDYAKWRADAFATAAKAPFMTWSNVWFNTACIYWPAKASTPVTVNGTAAPPILLLNATIDGATPYAGALNLRGLFPQARLVAENGATTHAGSTLAGNACIDKRVVDYLVSGTLPARKAGNTADVVCAASPKPEPGLLPFGAASTEPAAPAPDPEPVPDRSTLDTIVGLLPQRAF